MDAPPSPQRPLFPLALRGMLGGVLMGLANLVPGISGGTMLLAAGAYPAFIAALADVTRLRFRPRALLLLCAVGGAAALAILLLAGPVKALVEAQRWLMFSLFVGLTLGGLPLVWRLAKPATPATWYGAALGFGLMLLLAFAPDADDAARNSVLLRLLAGAAGAGAMILPGLSGGYLLLLLRQYSPILGAVEQLRHGEFGAAMAVLLPVALGALLGLLVISNGLRWLLRRHSKATLGALLGLLLGAVVGLWPFENAEGEMVFAPGMLHAAAALLAVAAGFFLTRAIGRIGDAAEE